MRDESSGADQLPELAEMAIRGSEVDEATLDDQPFGVIRLDRSGRILGYNLYEEQLARLRREDVIGKSFFLEVAPCTQVRAFYGRFMDGVAKRSLKATFSFVFKFSHGERNVEITMFYRQQDDTIWVLVRG